MRISRFIFTLAILAFALSCSHDRRKGSTWTYRSSDSDRLSHQLDSGTVYMWPRYRMDSLLQELENLPETAGDSLLEARCDYWTIIINNNRGYNKEVSERLKAICGSIDSATYTYDFMRIREEMYIRSGFSPARMFGILLESLEFYRTAGDSVSELHTLGELGRAMWNIGEYSRSLEYVDKTLELSRMMRLKIKELSALNNKAIMLHQLGHTDEARKIMEHLDTVSALRSDTVLWHDFLCNATWFLNRPEYLYTALTLCSTPDERCEIYLLMNTIYETDRDSVAKYTSQINALMDSLHDLTTIARSHMARYVNYRHRGETDSALVALEHYSAMSDSAKNASAPSEIRTLDQRHELAMFEALTDAHKRQSELKLLITMLTLAIVMIAGGLAGWQLWIRTRQRMHRMRLETESARMGMAASKLTIASKAQVLNSLDSRISDMQTAGNISQRDAGVLRSVIAVDRAAADEDSALIKQHEKIHSDFYIRMKQRYPDITEGQLKFASFILMKMSSKQISRLLMIQPEAVKKRRHRLRMVMGLAHDDSLEDALRRIEAEE